MKKKINLLFMIVLILVLSNCKKDSNNNNNNNNSNSSKTVPVLTTVAASSITQISAASGGSVTSDGGSTVTARGVCWSTNENPSITDSKTSDGTGTGSFVSTITGLKFNTKYNVRAYATNSTGTGYGSEITFTTEQGLMDIDGNIYKIVTIGTQVWMAENLKTTHYRNSDAIPDVTGDQAWYEYTKGAYCDYNNNAVNSQKYGRLYNLYAAEDSRNIAPTGWHVPTSAEWNILINYLGGSSVAGGKLKEAGTTDWTDPNTGATNESGFTALPGGRRYNDFESMGKAAYFWHSDNAGGNCHYINNSDAIIHSLSTFSDDGNSVRCVKD